MAFVRCIIRPRVCTYTQRLHTNGVPFAPFPPSYATDTKQRAVSENTYAMYTLRQLLIQ